MLLEKKRDKEAKREVGNERVRKRETVRGRERQTDS